MNQPSAAKPAQRRGLGRGLGSLIPTAPHHRAADHAEPPPPDYDDGHADAVTAVTGETASHNGSPAGAGAAGDGAAGSGAGGDGAGGNGAGPASGHAAVDGSGVDTSVPAPALAGVYFAELPVGSISQNPRQPRQVFEEEAMTELVHSVREVGLLQPVVVRETGAGSYELIMGERRWRAVQDAGLDVIPAIVRETGDDAMLRDALLENLHRAQLNPLEEAAAYQQLLDDFGCTHDELASRIGRSRPQISNTLRLLRLSPQVQRRVAAGVLSAGHARALLAVPDADIQDRLAGRVVAEGISVRGLEEIVAVGDVGGNQPRPQTRKPTAPALADLSARLSDRFETRVKVDLGRRKGRIVVEFATIDDLERIVAVMDPKDDRPI